jgi:hypothetical protein
MSYTKRIICLANSRKNQGRCFAGKELKNGRIRSWIRPVSELPSGQLSTATTRYADGHEAALLDLVDVTLISPQAEDFQTENHIVDVKTQWVKTGEYPVADIDQLLDDAPTLWINGYESGKGLNDRVPEQMAKEELQSSLLLIRPDDLVLRVTRPWDRKELRARFSFHGIMYDFKITDPPLESEYLKLDVGQYGADDVVALCVSLAPAFNGNCYKLVAGVIRG